MPWLQLYRQPGYPKQVYGKMQAMNKLNNRCYWSKSSRVSESRPFREKAAMIHRRGECKTQESPRDGRLA